MNQFLADQYGTGGVDEDTDALEKMAQLTLLVKEAEENDIDLSELSEEEALELADELYGDEEYEDEDDFEKEAAAKFEEADFLGRVMAHSMWQELDEIQKEAGLKEKAVDLGRRAYGATLGRVGKGVEQKLMNRYRGEGKMPTKLESRIIQRLGGVKRKYRGKKITDDNYEQWAGSRKVRRGMKRGAHRLERAGRIGAEAATTAGALGAVGGTAWAGKKGIDALRDGKKKKASAFLKLAEDRALEMLYDEGYIDEYGNVYGAEKTASAGDFDTTLDTAALEILEANGWPVHWNE